MQNHAQNKPPIRISQKGHCHQGLEFKSPIKICCLHFCFWNLTLSYIMVDPTPTKANMLHYTEHEWTVPLSCSLLKASVNNETFHSTMHCLVPKKKREKKKQATSFGLMTVLTMLVSAVTREPTDQCLQ